MPSSLAEIFIQNLRLSTSHFLIRDILIFLMCPLQSSPKEFPPIVISRGFIEIFDALLWSDSEIMETLLISIALLLIPEDNLPRTLPHDSFRLALAMGASFDHESLSPNSTLSASLIFLERCVACDTRIAQSSMGPPQHALGSTDDVVV
jgi:hypothetical protein